MKRWTIRICVLLILGALVNVAVAWGFAVFRAPVIYGPERDPLSCVFIWPEAKPESMWYIDYLAEAGSAHLRAYNMPWNAVPPDCDANDLPSWSRLKWDPAAKAVPNHVWTECARGWPCYALSSRLEENTGTGQRIIDHGLRIPYGIGEGVIVFGPESFLPLRVIWPGFAINTVFYAAVLWLLFAALFAFRRWRRIRRGQCPVCAYPVGTSEVCTECGAAIRQKAETQKAGIRA